VSSGFRSTKDEKSGEEDRLLTIAEAAKFLGLTVGGTYHLVSQRRIPVVRLSSRCIRFSLGALQKWIESLSQEADEFSESKARSAIRKQTSSVDTSGHK
jgi:excisionase family DNA binding protein